MMLPALLGTPAHIVVTLAKTVRSSLVATAHLYHTHELNEAFEHIAKATAPTPEAHATRQNLILRVQQSIDKLGQPLKVSPFGSFVSGHYDAKSDLDLVLSGQVPSARRRRGQKQEDGALMPLHAAARAARTRALHQVVAQLLADGVTSSAGVEDITKARVPLIRFVDCSSGVQVDLVAGSAREDLKAWLVAQAAELQPAFSPLFRLVKLWAKANGINDAASHTFNSWCITLLVIFHLQRHVSPPMLPPLQQLLHDAPPPARAPRLLQGDQELPDELRADVVRRVGRLKSRYSGVQAAGGGGGGGGGGAAPGGASLLELFRGFVRDGGGLMRAALHNKKPLTRPLGISPFYGDIRPCRPYDLNRMLLFVEDPFNSADNVARTLHRHKRRHGTTLDYITQLFERTARLLQADTGASTSTSSGPGSEPIPPSGPAAPNAADTGRVASHASASTSSSTGGGGGNAAGAGAGAGQAPLQPPSLASKLVFLFGPQLVNKLPDLSRRLLGPQLHAWAEEELEAGRRPVWEVHGELLRRLGADMSDFDTFADFKKRNRIKVINDDKYMTEEERTAAEDERVQRLAVKELSSRRVATAWAALPKCVPQLLAAARAALDAVPHLTFEDLAAVQPVDSREGGMPAAAVAAAPAATSEITTLIAGVRAAAEAQVLAAVSAAVEAEQGEVRAAAGDASDDSDGSAGPPEEAAPALLGAAGPDAATGFSARAAAAPLPPRTLHQLAAALQVEAAEAALRAVRELQAVRAMTAAGFSGADASAAQELADRSRVMALLTAAAAQELRARQGVLRSAQHSKLHRARGALPASNASALADGPSQAGALESAAAASAEAAAVDAAAAATAGSAAASRQCTAKQSEPAKAGTAKQSTGGGKPAAPQRKPTSPSASKRGSPADSPAAVAAAIAAAAASAAGKGAQPPKQPAQTQPGPLVTQPVRRSAKPRGARPAVQVKAGASGRASSTKARATAAAAAGQAAAKASQPRPKTPRRRGATAKPAASAEEK